MNSKTLSPFGTWPSSIDATQVAFGSPRLSETKTLGDKTYWLESVATQKGRITIMESADGQIKSILPQPFNVRSKVHEYGGGAYVVTPKAIYFVNAENQELYALELHTNAAPQAITQNSPFHYADLIFDHTRNEIIAVAEQHHEAHHVENSLVKISLQGEITTLSKGADFYAYPRLNATCEYLCWVSWQHPNMPWDNTELHVAKYDNTNTLAPETCIGLNSQESIMQPVWDTQNRLYFVSDRNNWWNIYRATPLISKEIEQITNLQAEFATPLWVFGMQNYGFIENGNIAATYTQNGNNYLCEVNITNLQLKKIGNEYSSIEHIHCEKNRVVFIASTPVTFPTVMQLSEQNVRCIRPTQHSEKNEISTPEAIEFTTGNNQTAYAFYYPPTNNKHDNKGRCPLIVLCHGGPTGQTNSALNYKIQYWSNRGFAVADVNYRGSTGFGREFRQSLYKQWGISDVEDMQALVAYLNTRGDIDPNKTIIKGSSAGGYTVLAALTFSDSFKAGVSLYGIGDLELLATDTHKFEAHYLDQLIGPYPETKSTYRARSPIHSVESLSCPLLLFQGLDDKVVPPNQARTMRDSVYKKGLPVALVEYEGEGHGFRTPATIEHMLNTELYFYQRVFKLGETKGTPPITIENLQG